MTAKKRTKVKKAARGRNKKASRPRTVQEELGAMAARLLARLEAQDRADRELEKAYEDGPMLSEPVWHVHQTP